MIAVHSQKVERPHASNMKSQPLRFMSEALSSLDPAHVCPDSPPSLFPLIPCIRSFQAASWLHTALLPGIPLLLLPALIPHPHPTQQTPVSEFLSVTPSCFYPLFHKWNHHTLLLSCCLCPSLSPLTVSLAPTPLLPQAKENRVVCPPLRLFHSEPLRDRRSPHSLPPTVGFLTTCTSIWINEQGHIFDQWDYVFMKNWSGIKL